MIKNIIIALIMTQLLLPATIAVCPVDSVMKIENIENAVKSGFPQHFNDNIYYNYTPMGFAVSVTDEFMFDNCNCLTPNGTNFLNMMADIMKYSGRKWSILCHCNDGKRQVDRISKSSLRAGMITNYLTSKEKCLINQLFPIGFGSIMPAKKFDSNKINLGNRIDFLIEDYNLQID